MKLLTAWSMFSICIWMFLVLLAVNKIATNPFNNFLTVDYCKNGIFISYYGGI